MFRRKAYCQNWYPSAPEEVAKYLSPKKGLPNPKGKIETALSFAIVPHAGWIYSGKVAGTVYSSLTAADTVIFVATNHTGLGPASSLFPQGDWETPLGSVPVEETFSRELLKRSNFLKPDLEAHLYEHAIEVQLPFVQTLNPETKIVPIEMRDYRLEVCKEIGAAIAQTMTQLMNNNPQRTFAVIASSDMTHCGERYGQTPPQTISPKDFARKQDQQAIDQILNMDSEGLLRVVKEKNITMCGSGPAAVVIESAKIMGARKGELMAYATSADVSDKDSDMAVGYAGIVIR